MLKICIISYIVFAFLPLIGTVALTYDWSEKIRDWFNGIN